MMHRFHPLPLLSSSSKLSRYLYYFSTISNSTTDFNGIIRSEFRHVPVNDSPVHNLILEAISRHSSEKPTRSALVRTKLKNAYTRANQFFPDFPFIHF